MPTPTPAREFIDATERATLEQSGTLVLDNQRQRPLYFDGRFLSAQALTQEQTYFLSRQAALNRTAGYGVVQGLEVRSRLANNQPDGAAIEILPGYGVTPSGEIVAVPEPLTVRLDDLAQIQALDATFGLLAIPSEPIRSLSGLFILGLRPVEYSDHPIASYPTAIAEPRSTTERDGEIVEATAVSLIRYGEGGSGLAQRAQAARQIFVEAALPNTPAGVLPLAMVGLSQGQIQWIDLHLVRRRQSQGDTAVLGLGATPRALRVAHLRQYEQHLQAVEAGANGQTFSAATHFQALPAAGRLPKTAINPVDFSQTYFPSDMAVELTVVPSDELAALVEESLHLPPIDLTAGGDRLASIALLVVIPITRQRLRQLHLDLAQASAASPSDGVTGSSATPLTRPLTLAAPGLIAKRSPLEVLQRLKLPRVQPLPLDPQQIVDNRWRQELGQTSELWYLRRRNLVYRADIAGVGVALGGNDRRIEVDLRDRLRNLDLSDRFNQLTDRASLTARGDVVSLLSTSRLASNELLLRSAVRELETIEPTPGVEPGPDAPPGEPPADEGTGATLDRPTVFRVAERFGDPRLGSGLTRLEEANPELRQPEVVNALADSGAVVELDRLARTLPQSELNTFSRDLSAVARRDGSTAANTFIRQRLEGIQR